MIINQTTITIKSNLIRVLENNQYKKLLLNKRAMLTLKSMQSNGKMNSNKMNGKHTTIKYKKRLLPLLQKKLVG